MAGRSVLQPCISLDPLLVRSLQRRKGDEAGLEAISSKMGCELQDNRTDGGRLLHPSSNRRMLRSANPQDQAESMGAILTEPTC